MKSISSALTTHLAGEVTTLATCWRVTRKDGREFYFTDHDRDLAFDGNTYLASSGYSRSAIANDAGMAVDNLDVEGVLDHAQISEQDLRAGLFDHAEVHVFLVNWADLSQGKLRLRRGWFGEVHLTDQDLFRTELRGMTQALSVRIGELYSPECRADLGDPRCRVPIEAPVIARGTPYATGDRVRVPTAMTGVATVAVPFVNAGFDAGSLSGWTVVSGSASAKTANAPLVPHAGSHFLEGNSVAAFEVLQTVDMTGLVDGSQVDAGAYVASFSCQRANGDSDSLDQGRVIVDLLDTADAIVATILDTGWEAFQTFGVWNLRAVSDAALPAGTRKIRLRFLGQRLSGSFCNAALDSVSATFTDPAAPLQGSAVYENRLYRCVTAGTTAAEQPAYATAIGAATTDGTAVFVAENAWSHAGTVIDVVDRAVFTAAIDEPRAADGWFDGGVLTWETGDNTGRLCAACSASRTFCGKPIVTTSKSGTTGESQLMPKVHAGIKPDILVWARESAGLSLEDAAKKLGNVKPERLARWEKGEDQPTINQLRKMARVYKRPLSVFYLQEVPARFRVMQDFRRLPGVVAGHCSPNLLLEIRTAQERRQLALELLQETGDTPPEFPVAASRTMSRT